MVRPSRSIRGISSREVRERSQARAEELGAPGHARPRDPRRLGSRRRGIGRVSRCGRRRWGLSPRRRSQAARPAELIARRALEHEPRRSRAAESRSARSRRARRTASVRSWSRRSRLAGHTPGRRSASAIRSLDVLAVGDHLVGGRVSVRVRHRAAYRFTLAGSGRTAAPRSAGAGRPRARRRLSTPPEALEIAEADLAYLRALHAAVAGALGGAERDRERAREAGLEVEPPRPAEITGDARLERRGAARRSCCRPDVCRIARRGGAQGRSDRAGCHGRRDRAALRRGGVDTVGREVTLELAEKAHGRIAPLPHAQGREGSAGAGRAGRGGRRGCR